MHATGADRGRHETGSAATEYALILSLVALCILAGVSLFGTTSANLLQESCQSVAVTQGSGC